MIILYLPTCLLIIAVLDLPKGQNESSGTGKVLCNYWGGTITILHLIIASTYYGIGKYHGNIYYYNYFTTNTQIMFNYLQHQVSHSIHIYKCCIKKFC